VGGKIFQSAGYENKEISMQNKLGFSAFTFFVLVLVLSIPFWLLGFVYPVELLPGLPISALGAFMPALAALILVYWKDQLAGATRLLRRSFDFGRIQNGLWIVVALLANPAIAILAYLLIGATGTAIPLPAPPTLTVLPMFALFFLGALGEEIGWAGYATEPLSHRWGILGGSMILGTVWAAWHFVPLIQAHRSVEWIAWWSLGTVSQRIIMVWLYFRCGKSVFAMALFHAMINLCWQLFPINGSFFDPRVFGLITLCLALATLTTEWRTSIRAKAANA
jgi:membrane protease YdiL (CAAX protease family)